MKDVLLLAAGMRNLASWCRFSDTSVDNLPCANTGDVIIAYMYEWELHVSNILHRNQDGLKPNLFLAQKNRLLYPSHKKMPILRLYIFHSIAHCLLA
jgi:hypothetical protein